MKKSDVGLYCGLALILLFVELNVSILLLVNISVLGLYLSMGFLIVLLVEVSFFL